MFFLGTGACGLEEFPLKKASLINKFSIPNVQLTNQTYETKNPA